MLFINGFLCIFLTVPSSALTTRPFTRNVNVKQKHAVKSIDSSISPFPDSMESEIISRTSNNNLLDRRNVISMFAMFSTATASTILNHPKKANAIYGEDAKIALPNVMESMDNRINKQCLVESLGNRECLVYLDPDKQLYKSADVDVLVERLEKSTEALAQIPTLVSEKKWSKVNGVITGPMGGLGVTMDKLSKLSENEEKACSLEKIVKKDLYAIAAAIERKNSAETLKLHEKATKDLVDYAKAL